MTAALLVDSARLHGTVHLSDGSTLRYLPVHRSWSLTYPSREVRCLDRGSVEAEVARLTGLVGGVS